MAEEHKTAHEHEDTKPEVTAPAHKGSEGKKENIDDVKVVSAVAYLGILFFIPMITNPKSKFAMFHANQGLLLLITGIIINVVGTFIPLIGWFIILPLGAIFTVVLFIMGLVNALGGHKKRLPLIGNFDIIKPEV